MKLDYIGKELENFSVASFWRKYVMSHFKTYYKKCFLKTVHNLKNKRSFCPISIFSPPLLIFIQSMQENYDFFIFCTGPQDFKDAFS